MKGLYLALLTLLAACGSTTPPLPPARLAVRDTAEQASRASQTGNWHAAAVAWHEAALQYATLDDWAAAGRAALGEAQALALGQQPQDATAVLAGVDAGKRYPEAIRAEAVYQLALIDIQQRDWRTAQSHLQSAAERLPQDTGLQAAIANAQGRVALQQGDPVGAAAWSAKALKLAAITPAERANAWRLGASAALAGKDAKAADVPLKAALNLDRQLARPAAIAADLRLMAQLAALRGDADADVWAERATAACQALKADACDAVSPTATQ